MTIFLEWLLAFAAVVFFAWLTTGAVRKHALLHAILDIPNLRSSHLAPTARGGGLSIVAMFLICALLLLALQKLAVTLAVAFICGGALVACVGFMDDKNPVPARARFAVHLLAAAIMVLLVGGANGSSIQSLEIHSVVVGGVIGLFLLAWTTNLFNFMDGIDGIAGSEAVFVSTAGAWLYWIHGGIPGLTILMLALAAASLGFLIWNWPPARIFMGDVGSGFVGFSLGGFALVSSRHSPLSLEVWAILGGVFLVDATLTLLRRLARGDKWYEAHRTHAYQHLASRWKSHLSVTTSAMLVNVFWLLPWAYLAANSPSRAPCCMVAALVPLSIAVFFGGAGKSNTSKGKNIPIPHSVE